MPVCKLLALAIALAGLMAVKEASGLVDIGSRLELFVDDFLIERMDSAELRLHHPVVREKVIQFDAPWEGDTSAYVTIFRDGDRYRMYYRGSRLEGGQPEVTCTVESTDGITWTRPKLRIFEFAGSKENNIVWMGNGSHGFTPFKDSNPAASAEAAYKAVGPMRAEDGSVGLYAFISKAGYEWKLLRKDPIITQGKFDSQNLAFWDAEPEEYVCYFRDFRNGVRDIKRDTSKDFVNWGEPEWLSYTGAPPEHLYTNAIAPYFRAPHIYVGFPKRFLPDRKAVGSHAYPGVSDGVLMTSRDGLNFHRWGEAFMRPGPDQGNWTDRNVMAAWGILALRPGEISLYYSQHYRHPTNHIVRATLRTDGFVSVHADAEGGEMLTKPLVFTGKELVLNYSTSAAGEVKVGLQSASGDPIAGLGLEDCAAIYGDEIERTVRWTSGSDLSHLAGRPIRLRFQLSDADLYSIRFRP